MDENETHDYKNKIKKCHIDENKICDSTKCILMI